LIVVAAAMAAVLTLSGSFVSGERCGIVASAIAGALLSRLLASRLVPNSADDEPGLSGAAGVLSMALGGLLLVGYFYADLKLTVAILLGAALCVAGGNLPTSWPTGRLWQAAFRSGLCLAILTAAATLTWIATSGDAGAAGYQ
jgi:hypothetical protein